MKISNDIKYVGVNDRNLDLFEGQYVVENGMAYNSYVIIDEKVAVIDSVDRFFGAEWLENIAVALNGRTPDYLVVQHMEPDHSSNILAFSEKYKDAKIVSSLRAFQMMKNYFGTDFQDRQVVVTKFCSRQTLSESSAHSTPTKTGHARQEDIISALSENTARRCNRF